MKKEEILAQVEAKRGYLLSYHRMLANDDPGLLAAYDQFYEKLTLAPRVLSAKEREYVWAGLLATAREEHGRIHMERAVKAGLTLDEIGDAIALAGAAASYSTLAFAMKSWSDWMPKEATTQRYLAVTQTARGRVPAPIAEMILAVCHAATGCRAAQRLHLVRAFDAGITKSQMAEAMSYLILPCGGPTLIDAASEWQETAQLGLCPSPY